MSGWCVLSAVEASDKPSKRHRVDIAGKEWDCVGVVASLERRRVTRVTSVSASLRCMPPAEVVGCIVRITPTTGELYNLLAFPGAWQNFHGPQRMRLRRLSSSPPSLSHASLLLSAMCCLSLLDALCGLDPCCGCHLCCCHRHWRYVSVCQHVFVTDTDAD